jgi:hypothetical protein
MARDDETMMRNALDAVDRGRRLAMIGVVALLVATVFALYTLFHVVGGPPEGEAVTLKAVFATAVSGMLLIASCTALVMMHATRLTKSILRALELTKPK